jgi:hypothetical protein
VKLLSNLVNALREGRKEGVESYIQDKIKNLEGVT